mmetsp:Transcript_6290/g.7972  ORF Transcript_6290/g.7972 Transcript_6290/m.7972 type:complete len:229 (+) Transcript_6290:224-910(+)
MQKDYSSYHVSAVFSDDDQSDADDKFRNVYELTIKGKKAMKSGGGLLAYKKHLVTKMNILSEKRSKTPPRLNLEDEYQCMLLDNWIDEVLRFLALKTVAGDNTEPCQLLPGHAVGVGWKMLMTSPSIYARVCLAMGNQQIFDHHPTDTAESRVQEKHKVKRFNATLRAYENNFDQQPPSLYWSFHSKVKKEEEDSIYSSMLNLCGCDGISLNPTSDEGMSPNMPSMVM